MKRSRVDWSLVDWSMPNRPLAEQLGVSVQAVAKARARRGQPKVRAIRPPLDPHALALRRAAAADARRAKFPLALELLRCGLSGSAVHLATGASYTTIQQLRAENGIPKRQRRDWSAIDWRLPLDCIAEATGCSKAEVCRQKRLLGLTRKYHLKPGVRHGRPRSGR